MTTPATRPTIFPFPPAPRPYPTPVTLQAEPPTAGAPRCQFCGRPTVAGCACPSCLAAAPRPQ